jgi:D-tyrosyl-tRNA(Tyr) deacylase
VIALLQRVTWGRLRIGGQARGEIGKGLVVLVGVEKGDDAAKADRLLHRLLNYRVFADAEGRMNRSLLDIEGEWLLVSQFTLAATTDKGLRPGFSSAMPPVEAEPLFDHLVRQAQAQPCRVVSGVFGADMQIGLENDGPVTFLLRV